MEAHPKVTTRTALAVLRPGPFRRYIIGSAISDTGSWMQVFAQGYVMSLLTTKAVYLGFANLAAGLPMLALTMIGGAAADRFDKRRILLITQYVQIVLALGLGFLIATNRIQIWHIFVFAAILGVSNSFEMPTLSALVPELVEKNQFQSAIAVDRAVFHGSRVVGPSVGGILIGAFGRASAFFFNALSFVALIIAIMTLPPRKKGTAEEEERRTSGIKDGFRHVAGDRPSLAMVALIATGTVCIFPIFTIMMPLYVRLVLGLGADKLGILMGASAIGSVVGAIFLLSVPRERRIRIMMGCVAVATCAIFGLSRAPRFNVVLALLIMNSLAVAMNFGLAHTIVQERAPDYLRGRVSAVFMLSFVGIMPFAGLGITSLSDYIGMPKALAIAAITYGIIGLFVLSRVRHECGGAGEACIEQAQSPPPVVATTV
jgi:MFS family permease